jgi:pyrimidine operon attenuation protein / uracil phosphoribosyltransferase
MVILTHRQISQKINRLAYQIAEENLNEQEIVLAGINNNGYRFAKLLSEPLRKVLKTRLSLERLLINPAEPDKHPIKFENEHFDLTGKCIILVDDVANTGRTIFYGVKPLLEGLPQKVQVAVLVDRKHKQFPIMVELVGLSLATTVQNNIVVSLTDPKNMSVHLE